MKTLKFALLIFITLSCANCAMILDGKNQKIILHCEPNEGVNVTADGENIDFINGQIHLNKKRETHFVTFIKDGYSTSTISFDRQIDPLWIFADSLWVFGAPIAWFIDWQTGAWYEINPKDIHVVLRKSKGENE